MATVDVTQPASDRAFAIETHGIDAIPASDRHGSPRELFSVWFAANVIFNYVISGAITPTSCWKISTKRRPERSCHALLSRALDGRAPR